MPLRSECLRIFLSVEGATVGPARVDELKKLYEQDKGAYEKT